MYKFTELYWQTYAVTQALGTLSRRSRGPFPTHRADVPPLVVTLVEDKSVARVLAAGRAARHEEAVLEIDT